MPYEIYLTYPIGCAVICQHAQEIYKSAFNSAWDEYKDVDERRGDDSREEWPTRSPGPRSRRIRKERRPLGEER